MKILLLGKNGQIGWELQRTLPTLGEIIALGREDLDLVDQNAICATVRKVKPDLIVNAAAYTNVDRAEEEPELAMAVNGIAPAILAEEAHRVNARIVHYSTDYVFDGTKGSTYSEEDIPNPLNTYAKTKLAGEKAIQETDVPYLILRTSSVYGLRGSNFLLKILRLIGERDDLKIVNDQIGSPTWCRTVAEATAQVLSRSAFERRKWGIYHLSATGETSWYDFTRAILSGLGGSGQKKARLQPISTAEFKSKVRRPGHSSLLCDKVKDIFNVCMPAWDESLNLVLDEINYREGSTITKC